MNEFAINFGTDRQLLLPDGFMPETVTLQVESRTRSISSIEEIYEWDRDEVAAKAFGTRDIRHPLVAEMQRRYRVLSKNGSRDVESYNEKISKITEPEDNGDGESAPERLPYIVVIIDELADLMMAKGKEVEIAITRLAQLARAVGIHMILATQRPSVDVITGVIAFCRIH